jgi:hypothetical protein
MALLDRLTLLIDADGSRATGELDKLGRKTKETLTIGQQFGRDFFQGLGVGAGAFSGLAAADALKQLARFSIDAARAAEDDSRAQFVLAKTLETTAGATFQTIKATEEYISTASDATGVTDDELRPALATLVRSTNDATEAQKLLTLALDVSAGTGKDVGTVSTALAKTYEGQTTALGRLLPEVGGLIREGASVEEVFAQLEKTYGGTAAEASAAAGSFSRLKVSAGELKEELGGGLTPAAAGFAEALKFLRTEAEKPLGEGATQGILGVARTALTAANPLVALGGALSGTGKKVADIVAEAKKAAPAVETLGSKFQNIEGSTYDWSDALVALKSSASAALSQILGLGSAEDRFADAIDGVTESTGGSTRATKDLIAIEFERESSLRSIHQAELDLLDAEKNLEDVRKGASDREKKRAALDTASAENRIARARRSVAEATNDLNKATGRRGNLEDAARARQALADALLEEQRATEDLTDTKERENEVNESGKEGSEDLADAVKEVEDAQWGLKAAIESARQSALQDADDGGPVGRSARQQRNSFREATAAAKDIVQELINMGAPSDVINAKALELGDKLREVGRQLGLNNDEIAKAADLLVAVGIVAQAEASRTAASIAGYGHYTLREELEAMRRQGIYVPDIAFQLAGGRATGGSVNAGSSYLVGEGGQPEVLHMGNSPGWVSPMGGGGTVTIQFNGPVVADKVTLESLLTDALESARRRGYNN